MNEINEQNKQIQQNELNESTYIYIHLYTLYIDFLQLGSAKQPGFFIVRVSFSRKFFWQKWRHVHRWKQKCRRPPQNMSSRALLAFQDIHDLLLYITWIYYPPRMRSWQKM